MADEGVGSYIGKRMLVVVQISIALVLFSLAQRHVEESNYKFPAVNTVERRIAFTLQCLAVSVLPLVSLVAIVGNVRFLTSAINPLSGNEGNVQLGNRILVNTVEQFLMHAFILLAYATTAVDPKFIAFYAAVFVVARVLFAVGYAINPYFRATGFALTAMPTLQVLIAVLSHLHKVGLGVF